MHLRRQARLEPWRISVQRRDANRDDDYLYLTQERCVAANVKETLLDKYPPLCKLIHCLFVCYCSEIALLCCGCKLLSSSITATDAGCFCVRNRLLITAAMVGLLFAASTEKSSGYDQYVYENLQKSRDALLSQRADLERNRGELLAQIDRLQQKVARIDQYLRQVDGSLRDVDGALKAVR